MRYLLFILILFLHLSFASPVKAQEMDVPVSIQVGFFFNILLFDRNFLSRNEEGTVLGILYQSKFSTSLSAKNSFVETVDALGIKTIKDKPLHIVFLDYNQGSWEKEIDEKVVNLLYVAPLQAVRIERIAEICSERRIISFSALPQYLASGLTVSIDQRGSRPQVLINLNSAKDVGANFSSQLLKLARLIEDKRTMLK